MKVQNNYKGLFDYLLSHHNLILTQSEENDLKNIIESNEPMSECERQPVVNNEQGESYCDCQLPIMRSINEIDKNKCKRCKRTIWQ